MFDKPLILSQTSKKKYLQSLIGKCHKILHLIQERDATGYSPKSFIYDQMIEVNEANELFEGALVKVVVKLKLIYNNIDLSEFSFQDYKRQLFEIIKILNSLLKGTEGNYYGN